MSVEINYQNIRGFRTKLEQLSMSLATSGADIICLTEAWLRPDILTSELNHSDMSSLEEIVTMICPIPQGVVDV